MPWFKVDDKFHDHRKSRAARKAAVGVWALAGSWCADNLTDGFVPESILPRWGTDADAAKLVDVGLWYADEQDGETGWRFYNWPEFQPSKTDVERDRSRGRRRVALHRDQDLKDAIRKRDKDRCRYCGVLVNWRSRRGSGAGTYDHIEPEGPNSLENLVTSCIPCNSSKGSRTPQEAGMNLLPPGAMGVGNQVQTKDVLGPRPVPTRPDPASNRGATKRATQLPDDWAPNDKHDTLAAELGVSIDTERQQFTDHHAAKGSTFKDWDRAFNTWLRNAKKFSGNKPRGQVDLHETFDHLRSLDRRGQ